MRLKAHFQPGKEGKAGKQRRRGPQDQSRSSPALPMPLLPLAGLAVQPWHINRDGWGWNQVEQTTHVAKSGLLGLASQAGGQMSLDFRTFLGGQLAI
jgi:hypothetical protein